MVPRILALIAVMLFSPTAEAGDLFDINRRHQPDTQPVDTATQPQERFGLAGQQYLTISGFSTVFSAEATDVAAGVAYSRFLADDFEWIVDFRGLHSNQPGDNVIAGNLRMIFRYHAISRDTWTVFGDIGVGVMVASDDVPANGTDVNFTPTLGIGATWQVPNSPARLVGGLRWHHISNARFDDDLSNPSRDDVAVFFGVSFKL